MSQHNKLNKLYALFEGTGSKGEREAALAAIRKIEAKAENSHEWRHRFPDVGSAMLFDAVCEKYGVETYRYKGEKRSTRHYKTTDALHRAIDKEFQFLMDQWREAYFDLLFDLMESYRAKAEGVVALIETSKKVVD